EFVNCMERLGQGRALHTCQVSMLRSLGRWSGGTSRYAEENSVLLAYYSAIAQAQRFVYIENELFISQGRNRPTDVTVKNRISFYLYKRILQARSRGEPFKVYIVIPLFPRHDGQLLSGSRGDYTSRKQMHFLYQTIFRGEDSLTHRLLQRHIAPHEYLSVCCLQKFDRLPDGWLAQEIYVQSNLLIADDRVAIIGSARIADHSLLGWRNSELAVRVEDVGFVRSLRMALWCEHLDVPPAEKEALISDPGDAAVWNLWCAQARSNSQIMQEVFRSLPNNAAYTMARLHDFAAISYLKRRAKLYAPDRDTMAQGLERLCQVKGQIVVCSGCFMEGSQLLKVQDKDQSWRSWFFWPDFALV
uniref:Phospholipase D n=1 Tax=Macrostomum lignano TaxID=282301 RepID=A0A1I8IZT2_9PLAT